MIRQPSQARVVDAFIYRAGHLFWRHKTGSQAAGRRAGNDRDDGYVRIKLDRRLYMAHVLIWVYHYGQIPDGFEIDHRDGSPANNAIGNLRLATHAQNGCNAKRPAHSTSGFKGVSQRSDNGQWRAYITVAQRRIWVGAFPTFEEAKRARIEAATAAYGEFARNE